MSIEGADQMQRIMKERVNVSRIKRIERVGSDTVYTENSK